MEIRSSERKHSFTNQLFQQLGIYSLGGLTLDKDRHFTACVEAIEFDVTEKVNLRSAFTEAEVDAKLYLANELEVPLFFMIAQAGEIKIYRVQKKQNLYLKIIKNVKYQDFPLWWAGIKQTKQPKPIYEASNRIKKAVFDTLLTRAGLAWGGNVDGFIFREGKILAIIENIYTHANPLESPKGEPSYYFKGKGPGYNSWEPTVMLANTLGVPLFLFTFEGKNNKKRLGFAMIDHLSIGGIFYKGSPPNENIIDSIEAIEETINDNLGQAPPYILR